MPLTATEIEAIVEENFAEDIKLPSDVSSWTESDFTIFLHCGLDDASVAGEEGGEELRLWKEH